MTAGTADRRRSLQDDLLDDLRQAPVHPAAVAARPRQGVRADAVVEPAPAVEPGVPAVEVRITPRSWTGPALGRGPAGDGLTVSLGPVRLSLGRLRP